MKRMLEQLRVSFVLTALLCVVSGVVLMIWPDTSARVVCMLVGIVLLVMGIMQLVRFFGAPAGTLIRQINLLMAIILAAVGVWILFRPDFLIGLIPIIMGILLILHGLYDLQQAVFLIRAKYSYRWLALALSLVTVALGAVLIWNPFEAMNVMIMFMGGFLIYDGLSDLWILSRARRFAEKVRDAVEDEMALYQEEP